MIRCIVVDDEPLALGLIVSYVGRTPFLELVGSYTDAMQAMAALQNDPVDLLFLDIQMPGMTGLELASAIDTFRTKVVFTTAFDCYALEGFKVDAIDYLLKPISYDDFQRSAHKAQRLVEHPADNSAPQGDLVVRADHRLVRIAYGDILYLEALRDYVAIYLDDGTSVKTLSTLKGLESILPKPTFMRVQRSFVVNIGKVNVIERNRIIFSKRAIPISEGMKEEVLRQANMKR